MERKKTTQRPPDRRQETANEVATGSPGGRSGDLLQQARSFAAVAREAHDNCEKGQDAEAELRRRNNRSGQ